MPDISQVSFSRGEVSPIAAARTDAAFYQNALNTCVNFFVRAEGGVSNRPGLQYIASCASANPNGSYLVPFIYNNEQSYVCEFAAGLINVYANAATVETNITTTYTISDLPNLRWAQSADVLNVVVATNPPYTLTRNTVSSFSFTAPNYVNGPFQDLNTDGTTTVYASGTQGSVTITASNNIFLPTHVGSLFTIQEQYLAPIIPWESERVLFQGTNSPIGLYCRSDGKIYKCVNTPGTASTATATGTFQPVHVSGTQQDGDGKAIPDLADIVGVYWQFVSTNAGVAKITNYISPTQVKATVQSYEGVYSNFPPTVVGGPQTVQGPFTYTGTGAQTVFTGLTGITTADPNQYYVTIAGVFQDPSTYVVSLSGTSITFYTPPANGASVSVAQVVGTITQPEIVNGSFVAAQPMQGLCLSTYWAFGSFSPANGYPATVVYFNDRLVFGGCSNQPQTFFASQTSVYVNFGVSNPTVDTDSITATINARRENPIVDLIPLNDLLIGSASTMWRVTHSTSVGAITPSDISLLPQNFYGEQPVPSVQTGDTVIYVQWGGRKIRDLAYQFQYDKFVGTELTVFARQMFPVGTSAMRMAFAPEPYGLLYVVRSDGVLCVCTYLPEQQVTAWSRYTTQGFFEDVCVVPENGTYSVYVIVRRTVNGVTVRYIERFAPRETSSINDYFFVDSGLTYDGRNTNVGIAVTVTGGTTWVAGDVGSVSASSGIFQASDVTYQNAIWLTDGFGNRLCRLQITAYLGANAVSVLFLDPVPAAVQGYPTSNYTFARTLFSGLTNLVGATVAVQADGTVLPQLVVSALGTLTLPVAGGVVHAGLPYISQLESMQLNQQGEPSIRNLSKTPGRMSVVVDESSLFYVGADFNDMNQSVQREFENYGQPTALHTGVLHVQLPHYPSDDATVCLQMTDPAPLTVLGWQVEVDLGEPG